MKPLIGVFALCFLFICGTAHAGQGSAATSTTPSQSVIKAGAQPSIQGSSQYFTGKVRIDPLFVPNEATHASGAYVTFEPGARSFWHTHPSGQTLLVTYGVGRTQEWGGPIIEIRPGDVVYCPPRIKHWHGAGPTSPMTHIALTGSLDGKNVSWLEQVTDTQYSGK